MIDGKMTALLQGDTGAFCHLCTITRDSANDMVSIEAGFNITKDVDTCLETWRRIESGEIPFSNTFLRKGQCHQPLNDTQLIFFSLLHFKLRTLDFCLKILYHLVAGIKDWSESNAIMRFFKAAKEECINHIAASTGLVFDKPTDQGGNTNCGPIATQFFSPSRRPVICSIIKNSEDRDNFSHLLMLLNAYITIVEKCDHELRDIEKVKAVGIKIMHHIRKSFLNEKGESWIYISPSVHQTCAHAWELFDLNNGRAISIWSETPVESWNKYVRSYQSGVGAKARQHSIKDNLRDVLSRMLIESHPKVASAKPRPSCSVCGEVGHTARSSLHSGRVIQSRNHSETDDTLIKSMYASN